MLSVCLMIVFFMYVSSGYHEEPKPMTTSTSAVNGAVQAEVPLDVAQTTKTNSGLIRDRGATFAVGSFSNTPVVVPEERVRAMQRQ